MLLHLSYTEALEEATKHVHVNPTDNPSVILSPLCVGLRGLFIMHEPRVNEFIAHLVHQHRQQTSTSRCVLLCCMNWATAGPTMFLWLFLFKQFLLADLFCQQFPSLARLIIFGKFRLAFVPVKLATKYLSKQLKFWWIGKTQIPHESSVLDEARLITFDILRIKCFRNCPSFINMSVYEATARRWLA